MDKDVLLGSQHIAITPEALETMISLSHREVRFHSVEELVASIDNHEQAIAIQSDGSESLGISPQFESAVELLGKRWTWLIICALMNGDCRFTQITDRIPQLSDTILAQRLKELQKLGIIRRFISDDRQLRYVYKLTKKGRALKAAIEQVQVWASRWM